VTYEQQLWIGVVAFVVWNGVLLLWLNGRRLGVIGTTAAVLALEASLIILVGGSLRLLEMLSDDTWFLVGTIGRLVVALTGIVALVAVAEDRRGG